MLPVPDKIQAFIRENHVLSLCTRDGDDVWAASCFYAYAEESVSFIVLSSLETRHGRAMSEVPGIAGTIAGQPEGVRQIRGIQFTADAFLLAGNTRKTALHLYTTRHPIAKLARSDVWELRIRYMKFTDNRYIFGQKTCWDRSASTADGMPGIL